MTIKVKVNVGGCVGHARCEAVAPEVYELDDNGFNTTPLKTVDTSLKAQAVRGARACPEQIITIIEDGAEETETDAGD